MQKRRRFAASFCSIPKGFNVIFMSKRKRFSKRFSVRVTDNEWVELCMRAKARGWSLSRYMVEASLAPSGIPSAEERERQERALFHVRKVGVNLNQIAKQLNMKQFVSGEYIEKTLEAQTVALEALAAAILTSRR